MAKKAKEMGARDIIAEAGRRISEVDKIAEAQEKFDMESKDEFSGTDKYGNTNSMCRKCKHALPLHNAGDGTGKCQGVNCKCVNVEGHDADRMKRRKPIRVVVDAICVAEVNGVPHVLLVKRGRDPFKGRMALPGGHVEYGEEPKVAVLRELMEETGINGKIVKLHDVYGKGDRDPRGHYVDVVYEVKAFSFTIIAGDDAESAKWCPIYQYLSRSWDKDYAYLAFDHSTILTEWATRNGLLDRLKDHPELRGG